jgi:hypothetical protein
MKRVSEKPILIDLMLDRIEENAPGSALSSIQIYNGDGGVDLRQMKKSRRNWSDRDGGRNSNAGQNDEVIHVDLRI